eukprot:gene20771-27595_t
MFGNIFGGLKKAKSKLSATRFQFTFTVHNLNPWPAGNKALAIGWQRGKKKRGATRSVYTSTAPGRLGAVVRFNEKIDFNASLYKANDGRAGSQKTLGPFKKKCIIMAVLETDGRTQATAALGRIVIDLAEFASVDGQQTRTFQVACNKAIHSAVGEPQLTITIRCQWKKSGGPAVFNADGEIMDDNNSTSTDTTGSRMTANLSSFLRFKLSNDSQPELIPTLQVQHQGGGPTTRAHTQTHTAPLPPPGSRMTANLSSFLRFKYSIKGGDQPMNEEQDLQGFDARPSAIMSTIQEGADEFGESPPRGVNGVVPPLNATSPVSLRQQQAARSASAAAPLGNGNHEGNGGGNGLRATYSSPATRQYSGGSLPSPSAASSAVESPQAGMSSSAAAGGAAAAGAALASSHQQQRRLASPTASDANEALLEAELVCTSAMEVCVYLARILAPEAPGESSKRAPHRLRKYAPARRLARTITCLGPANGLPFGQQALQVLTSLLQPSQADNGTLVFWWSNCVHLRGLLQGTTSQTNHGTLVFWWTNCVHLRGLLQGTPSSRWAAETLVPSLVTLEATAIFERMLNDLWSNFLLPPAGSSIPKDAKAAASTPTPAAAAAAAAAPPLTKRAHQEAAIKKWFEGLDMVALQLSGFKSGTANALRQQLMVQCLKRLDALLFHHLLLLPAPPQDVDDLLQEYNPDPKLWGAPNAQLGCSICLEYNPDPKLWGAPNAPMPQVEDSSLPFTRGLLTFASGMSVKMTVTRLQQWANGEGITAESLTSGSSRTTEAMVNVSGAVLFPLMRAAADLLMMPKELLTEQAIRRDVCQSLSMRSMIHILENFQVDEYAHDVINPDLLLALKDELAASSPLCPPLSDLSVSYRSPSDNTVWSRGGVSDYQSDIEYGAESEEELEEIAKLSTIGAKPPARFRLLHNMWSQVAPKPA